MTMAVTRGELVKSAYAAKGVKGTCELCGSGDWGINEELKYLPFSEADENGALVGFSQVPVVVMTCSNCGSMRIHAIKVLAGR